ncbi:MAG: type II secretion system protein, partial [Planctomycetota bacterium]
MKSTIKTISKRRAYTIIELLTVMSIIVILISLLVPAMQQVRQFAQKVEQNAQFHSIGVALELFEAETERVPDSDEYDSPDPATRKLYCGAEKLAEAMMGQDLLGFHPDSIFRRDGTNGLTGNALVDLYPPNPLNAVQAIDYKENLKARTGPFLPLENANVYPMTEIYPTGILTTAGFIDADAIPDANNVLCDVYKRVQNLRTGRKIGMPILYYRADTSKNSHNVIDPDDPDNIYNYLDNNALVKLGIPWDLTKMHTLAERDSGDTRLTPTKKEPGAEYFYENIRNKKISSSNRPYRADT